MIIIPKNFKPDPFTKDFEKLIDFFNRLEDNLNYPNCSGFEDQNRVLENARKDLIMWGKC